MTKLSICIPTYNRAKHLSNCLESIIANKLKSKIDFELCISDNCSTDETSEIISKAKQDLPIKYQKNEKNLGVARNVLKVVEMANSDFVWLIGDDDLLVPNAIEEVISLIETHPMVDYFYINSYHLTTEFVFSFPQPFQTSSLPEKMEKFSSWDKSGETAFIDLINPKISFDFLGGMFLAVFRRSKWVLNAHLPDKVALTDNRVYSHFDNTFVHVKIFSKAFANSKAYFHASPLSVSLTGAREWSPMYPLVHSVRLVEALDEYRKNGLPFLKYLRYRNFALNYFIPDLILMFLNREKSGFVYINPLKLILNNCIYPNFYFSFFRFFFRKIKKLLNKFIPISKLREY